MVRVNILCEGQTEESFVNELLYATFLNKGIFLNPIICETKRERSGRKYKGGVSTYGKIKKDLTMLCKSHPSEYVTMMFDYYALPSDTPGYGSKPIGLAIDKAVYLEKAIAQDINALNFIPNIILYEFESLLFSKPEAFSYCGLPESDISELRKIRDSYTSPEDINDGADTAPSKRILKLCPSFGKVIHGVAIAENIGIDKIMSECEHFRCWVEKIMSISAKE